MKEFVACEPILAPTERRETMSEFDKLEAVARPVVEYLRDNYDPHTSVTITDVSIVLNREEMGIPVEPRD